MQNTVDQNKRGGLDCCNLHLVTYSHSGNNPANGLVTETVLLCAVFHYFTKRKNNIKYFIISRLCLSFVGLFLFVFQESYHVARHTFATETCLANGVPIETISKMMGHSDIKTTQIYAEITNQKVSRDFGLLSENTKDLYSIPEDNMPSRVYQCGRYRGWKDEVTQNEPTESE